MRKHLILALAAGLLLSADANDDAVKKDLQLLEGTWKVTSLEADGMQLPEENFKEWKLECKGADFTFTDTNGVHKGTFKVDPSKKPKTLDVVFTEGGNKGSTLLCLYEVEKDTFKVCVKPNSQERPTEFTGKQGSGQMLEVLKKEKK